MPQHIPHGLHLNHEKEAVAATNFASAHPARIASPPSMTSGLSSNLCLSTSRTDCIRVSHECIGKTAHFASAHPARIASGRTSWALAKLSFASAHPARIASIVRVSPCAAPRPLPQHIPHGLHPVASASASSASWLCLSTSRTDCISKIAQMQCHKSTQYAVSW